MKKQFEGLFGDRVRGLSAALKLHLLLAALACLLSAPALAAFTDNGDGTVSDTVANLTWQRCSVGQTSTGSTCSGSATGYTWDAAVALTDSFAGQTDWRLPTMTELLSLVKLGVGMPTIDTTAFPNTIALAFWSGSSDAYNAWSVDFYSGNTGAILKTYDGYVRLVRSGQPSVTPTCTLMTSQASITAGGSSTLTASCSPAATYYTWTGGSCAGTSAASCSVAPAATTTYTVAGVNASGTSAAASATVTVTPVTVTAAPAMLTVTKSGSGFGIIASSPTGIDCGATCSGSFAVGTPVTLTATPASGSYFAGWGGACSGVGSCEVEMDEALNVTATFKAVPFVATTTSTITATSATISTTVSFNPIDVGKTGAVYVTAWAPASGLTALGILAAPMSHAMSVTTTRDNPYTGGAINTRQETLAAVLAAADPNAFVLVQLASSGWQLVQNGQLIPYASGVLGDSMSALNILNTTNPSNLLGAQFCVGYGTSAAEMVASGRMMPVADIPGGTVATNGSCNVAANPYKGLWWNPAENGWGMSVTQHDSINFVAMYTYDTSAQPVWYVMSDCRIATAGSCTGNIYKVVGGKSPTQPWVALNFAQALSTAGSGTLTFSDANNGRFDFTLNGVPGYKIIQRQLFSSGTAAQAVDYSDLWWNANESGWGLALTQDVGMIFATWYTYDAAGLPVWYVASSCTLSGSGCTGYVYKVTGGEALTAAWNGINPPAEVGSVTFAFSDSSTGTMSYTIDGVAGSRAIVRQAF